MDLTPEDIEEFREIYRTEFGKDIEPGKAKIMADRLLRLYAIFAQPFPEKGEEWSGQ